MRSYRLPFTPALVVGLAVLSGCTPAANSPSAATAAPRESRASSITCPSGGGESLDIGSLFGVEPELAAHLQRTLKLARSLENAAAKLDQDVRATCGALAEDLRAPASSAHPCSVLVTRVEELRRSLGEGGLTMSLSGLSCSLPKSSVESCAGQCLTGQAGVVSAVSCAGSTTDTDCGLAFSLPNAAPECVTECAAASLHEIRCSAEVDVRIGRESVASAEYQAMAEALRRDVPRLVGLATSVAPRAAALASEVATLVDEAAASIDRLSDAKLTNERRWVAGAVLASCLAPELGATVRASASLTRALSGVAQAHASLGLR